MSETATTTWYLATCLDCEPVLPQPFSDAQERDRWADIHRGVGHRVLPTVEVR